MEYKTLRRDEHFFGLGEKTGKLDRRGEAYKMWNSDKPCYSAVEDPLYKSIPFFMSSYRYGIFLDNTYKTEFKFGTESRDYYSFEAPGGEMIYYFIFGKDYKEIMKQYVDLTGKPIMPPKWALGFAQCRGLLTSEKLSYEIAEGYRKRGIPCDVIYQDIGWTQYLQDFEWRKGNYENPKKMLADLKDMGFNFKEHGTGFDTIQARYIFRLNVEGKTEEEVMASFHPKTRYNTRLAARKGVTVEIKGIEACEEFHELMLITGERDSFATRDTSYFERIMNAFGDDARIYLAKYEGKTIAGALDVHCGDKVWYVYGASSNEYRNVMPNYLVQWEMIRWAIAEGCRYYDFRGGYPDENNPLHGIFKFKKGFCNDYMELMGEADLIINKFGYEAVGLAQKAAKKTRGLRAKIINRK